MDKPSLLLATTNPGKAKEFRTCLRTLPFEIISLEEIGLTQSFPEEGDTFLANARGKSLFYSRRWKGLTVAEDSGLEVRHLDGSPGVYSARFAGPQATDAQNNSKVLALLSGIPAEKRQARFVSCLVLAREGTIIKEIQEDVEGLILFEPRGSEGFGYDPIFFFPPLNKSFGELNPEEKNRVSHRGKALQKLKSFLLGLSART